MADLLAGGGPLPMIDLNPISWLGDAASAAVADAWKAAMIGLWSAGLWLLSLAFKVIDALTTPDLSAQGPMGAVLPTTLWIGASLAGIMIFVQLTVALLRRDGRSLGRVLLGVAQFGLVWVGYLGVAGALVAAAAGLSRGILHAMLNVDGLSAVDPSSSWPRELVDTTVATVLGLSSLLLLIPAAFCYLVIMFVREAALIILAATAPISAGGLLSDSTRTWFWKSLRWFISCLLISPTAALVLGIGVKLSAGVVAGSGDSTAQAAGTAVVGAVMIAIGALCPLVLFRLLAFVEPGTASGTALRQSWAESGGLPGLLSGGRQSVGSGAAALSGGDGRSGGEAAAEAQSAGRLAAMLGPVGVAVGAGTGVAASLAHRAVNIGTDLLGAAGVGHPGYGMPLSGAGGSRPARATGGLTGGGSDARDSAGGPEFDGVGTPATPPPGPPPSDGGPRSAPPHPASPIPSRGLAGWARAGTSASGAEGTAAAETAATVAP